MIFNSRMNFLSQSFLKNIVSSTTSYLLKFVVNFYITNQVIKYLGLSNFGVLSYIISLGSIVGSFGSLGYESILPKIFNNCTNHKESKNLVKFIGSAFTSVFVVGLLISIFFYAIIFLFDKESLGISILYGLSFPLLSYNVIRYYLEYKLRIRLLSKINNIVMIALSIVKLIIIRYDLGLFYIASITFFEAMILLFLYVILFERIVKGGGKLLIFSMNKFKYLIKKSYPFLVSSMLIMFYMKIDQIILKHSLGTLELGKFSSTIRLVELFYFFPVVFQTAYNGHFLSTIKDEHLSKRKIFSISLVMFYISASVFLFFLFFSQQALEVIYGSIYKSNGLLLKIYSLVFVFVSFGTVRNIRIYSIGASQFYMYITLIGLVLNLVSNLILIPIFGVLGCAFSAIISQFFISIISSLFHPILREDILFFLKNIFNFKEYKSLINLS